MIIQRRFNDDDNGIGVGVGGSCGGCGDVAAAAAAAGGGCGGFCDAAAAAGHNLPCCRYCLLVVVTI